MSPSSETTISSCAGCGAPNPAANRFCGACGTPLSSDRRRLALRGDERKIVTILFADITGFTAFSENMDPEEVKDTIQELFGRFTRIVTHYGGAVDKYIGDCVMALFGAPISHENDPERAIQAALAMQAELAVYRKEKALRLGLRIGINTGTVLAGHIGGRATDYTVIGDEVNLAARLEQSAPVDGILIGAKTYPHVQGRFELQALPPIQVKGKAEPIQVFRVLGQRAPAGTRSEGRTRAIRTRMVGREEELWRMLSLSRKAWDERRARGLLIKGAAGLGKSRLLYEFHRALEAEGRRPQIWKARALPYTTNIPYYLFASLLKERFGISDQDHAPRVREKFLSGVCEVMGAKAADAEEAAHLMGCLVAVDFPDSAHLAPLRGDPLQLRQRAHRAFLDFFRAAAQQPVLLYLGDLHWSEQSSVDLALEILDQAGDLPLVMMVSARPDFQARFPAAAEAFRLGETIDLSHLKAHAVCALIRELLHAEEAPESLERMVIEKSSGNPYYVEELLRVFTDKGLLETREGRVVWTRGEGNFEIPDTIQGLLQARLDELTSEEKGVLQRGAVMGNTFWRGAIEALFDEKSARSDHLFADLSRKELIFPAQQASAMGEEFIFKHAILRDVTYETILKKNRFRFHSLLARWLEENTGDRRTEFLHLIALHYELGGVMEKAAAYYFEAGEQALRTFSNREALQYYDKTVELARPPAFEHYRRRGGAREVLGDYAGACADYMAMLEFGADERDRGVAFRHLAEIKTRLGEFRDAADYVDRMMEIAKEAADPRATAEALNLRGRIHDLTGNTDEALRFYRQSMEAHRGLGDRLGEATGLGNIGIIHLYRGEYDQAITAYKAALEIDRAEDNKRRVAIMTSNIGETYQFLGALREAEDCHRQALELAREIGLQLMQVEALRNLGSTQVLQGKPDLGLPSLSEALRLAEALGDMEVLPQALFSHGEGLWRSGRDDAGLAVAERLLALAQERNVKDFIAKGLLLKSRCCPAQRLACLELGLPIAEELRSQALLAEFHGDLAVLREDRSRALTHAAAARRHVAVMADAISDQELRRSFLASRAIASILESCQRREGRR